MAEPPPPSSPPPGWYPDPADSPGYRWWDGQEWTESIADGDALSAGTVQTPYVVPSQDPSKIQSQNQSQSQNQGHSQGADATNSIFGSVGSLLSETFRVAIARSGHLLPVILFFVLAVSLPTSFGIWYALQDTVLTFDQQTGATDIDYGGSQQWLIAVIALLAVATILSLLARGAIFNQTVSALDEEPEPWSDSVTETLRRAGRIVPFALARTLIYWSAIGLFIAGVVFVPVVILLLPVLAVGLVIVWVRLAFVGAVAALGGSGDKPFSESLRLSAISQLPLAGRLLVLAIVSLHMILAAWVLGAPFTALAGGGASAVESSAETLRFNDLLGPNPSVFAIGSLFIAIGVGVNQVLTTVGTTLLYRSLGGPVEGAVAADVDSEDASSAVPSP